jgi:hypothetical protein
MIMPDSKESSYFHFLWTCFASKFFIFLPFTFRFFFFSLFLVFTPTICATSRRAQRQEFLYSFLFYFKFEMGTVHTAFSVEREARRHR